MRPNCQIHFSPILIWFIHEIDCDRFYLFIVGEVPCGCSEHVGRTIINDVYSCDVETMFKLIFTDSDFMRNFYKLENATSE